MVKNIHDVAKVESREYEILIRVGERRRVNVIMKFIFSQWLGNSGKSGLVKWVYILIRCQSFTHTFF